MSEFGKLMDRTVFDRLLGEMIGAIAELEGEGEHVMAVADAAVFAAIRKVQRTQTPSAAHAWSLRMQQVFAGRVALSDALAAEAEQRIERRRGH